jgi:uncharacterized protein
MRLLPILALLAASPPAAAQTSGSAATAEPAPDPAHPPRLIPVRYASGGVQVPARLFLAGGAGPHGTVRLLHGFPGTELNLDLARALQRAGWHVLAIHYRGVWGAPGRFGFGNVVADAHAALAWLRSPAAARHGIDPARIVALGHSMGGFAGVMLGDDPALAGFVLIAPADLNKLATLPPAAIADEASYTNATPQALIAEVRANAQRWRWSANAARLAGRPLLVVTADDGLAPDGEAVVAAARGKSAPPTLIHIATDHSFNDSRLVLADTVIAWLARNVAHR